MKPAKGLGYFAQKKIAELRKDAQEDSEYSDAYEGYGQHDESFDEMIEVTGVCNGDKLESEEELRDYLTVRNMNNLFGAPGEKFTRYSQEQLDKLADYMLENGIHCSFSKQAQEDTGGPKWTSPGKKNPGPVDKAHKPANPDSPKVYVGTYAKYNSGSIEGAWLNLDDYSSYEEFIQAAKELHSDEADPELMFQDTENVPDWAYSESSIDPKFFEFMDLTSSWDDERAEGFKAFLGYYYPGGARDKDMTALVEEFEERYQGKWNSMEDFAMNLIDDIGGVDQVQNKEWYFDREMFARDLGFEGWNDVNINDVEASPEDYPQGEGVYDPDGEFAGYDTLEDMVDAWLDDGIISGESLNNYFDYEKFANDLELGGDYNEVNGFVFDNH